MLELINTKRAAERLLLTVVPSIPTAFENVDFEPPDSMYQVCFFNIRSPDDTTFPAGYHRDNMQMVVLVVDKKGNGIVDALTRASQIRDTFYRGLVLNESGTRIMILNTAHIAGATPTEDNRIVVPVTIDLKIEVFK